jgi:hypothetical protein
MPAILGSVSTARRLVAGLTVSALALLVLSVVAGFEEPHDALLVIAALFLAGIPLVVVAHLTFTRELAAADKRIWRRALTGKRALVAWAEYLTCDDLHVTAARLQDKS